MQKRLNHVKSVPQHGHEDESKSTDYGDAMTAAVAEGEDVATEIAIEILMEEERLSKKSK
jgi:hypothetical protein